MSTPTVPAPLQPRAFDRPPREERWGAGASLSVVAHLALVAGLAWSVRWHTDSGETVEAELWAAVPQAAAPAPAVVEPTPTPAPAPEPAPPPPPPPVAEPPAQRTPDIVTERDQKLREREKQKQQQLEQEKRDKAEKAEQLKQQQQQAKLDQQKKADEQKNAAKMRADQMARIAAMAGGQAIDDKASGRAARSAGPSAGYAGRIQARIRPNIRPIREFDSGLKTDIELRLGADGTILSRRVKTSSGDPAWDDEALKAVDRTAVLPRDIDGTVPSTMIVTIKPES